MKRRTMRKLHNGILKASAYIATIVFLVSGCMLDEPTYTPAIICGLCVSYLALLIYANKEELKKWN